MWNILIVFILFGQVVNAYDLSLLGAHPEGCEVLMSLVSRGTKAVAHKVATTFSNPNDLTASQYKELRAKAISEYFPSGKITTEELLKFEADFKKLAQNFPKNQLGGKTPRDWSKLVEDKSALREMLLDADFLQKEGHKNLEAVLMDFRLKDYGPAEVSPWSELSLFGKIKRGSYYSLLPPYWLAIRPSLKLSRWLLKEAGWMTRLTLVAIPASAMLMFSSPVSTKFESMVNENLGEYGIAWAQLVSGADQSVNAIKQNMGDTVKEMAEVNRKYKMKEMSHEDARIVWNNLEKTFLAYRNELYSLVPDNIAAGRTYFRDGSIYYPMLFTIAFMSTDGNQHGANANIRLIELKGQIGELKRQLENKENSGDALTEKDKEDLETYRTIVDSDKSRLGTLCAMMRIHEMMYPEFNRAKFMSNNPEMIPLMNTYHKVVEGLRLEEYADAYLDEMNKVLSDLDLPLAPKHTKN